MTDQDGKKPRWPMLAVVLLLLPALYVLSFGPAFCWYFTTAPASPRIDWAFQTF